MPPTNARAVTEDTHEFAFGSLRLKANRSLVGGAVMFDKQLHPPIRWDAFQHLPALGHGFAEIAEMLP
jgi:hypothetical protein